VRLHRSWDGRGCRQGRGLCLPLPEKGREAVWAGCKVRSTLWPPVTREGAGTARAKGLSPAAPAVPAQRRRSGGWKTVLWAHLGSSCRARARAGHVAPGRPALECAGPRLQGGAVRNTLSLNTCQQDAFCSVHKHAHKALPHCVGSMPLSHVVI
jgi:hypothetical protein